MTRQNILLGLTTLLLLLISGDALAAQPLQQVDLTHHPIGYIAIAVFALAYGFVVAEEFTQLRKSKPVVLAAGIIWVLIAAYYVIHGITDVVEQAVRHSILDYAELMLFLLVAMTYINVLQERKVFDALRAWLISRNFGYRKLFWLTGILAFFISPIADNLTTALLMCAVVMAVGVDSPRFVSLSCINIVVAANAGGAFSPFGDITTLMVWQKGMLEFSTFFLLFVPAVINFLIPAIILYFAVPNGKPVTTSDKTIMKRGAIRVMALFCATIITAVSFHRYLDLPPMLGMMTGLAYLQFFSFYLKKTYAIEYNSGRASLREFDPNDKNFDIFNKVAMAEWDTLLFFYGVVLCVGGLAFIGYLGLVSQLMYVDWGPTNANIVVGLLSAIIDNIPMMFAVLSMQPEMSQGQWLLVTLTTGVGGSLLSIGSAAGVALMGQSKGSYTFFSHLKWSPAIALGYAASIASHMWLNAALF